MAYKPRKLRKNKIKIRTARRKMKTWASSSKYQLGFPAAFYTKLKYVETIKMPSAAGASSVISFKLNSLYDHHAVGGTGVKNGQPSYYDQLAAVYNLYAVIGAHVKVTVYNGDGTPLAVRMYPSLDPTALTATPDADAEQKGAIGRMCTDQNAQRMTRYYSMEQIAGIRGLQSLDSGGWASFVTGEPGSKIYLHVVAEQFVSTGTFDCYVQVELTTFNRFSRVKQIQDV